MKETHSVIKKWTLKSGVHYDDVHGAKIECEASARVFDEWVSEQVR